jgi:mRNA interferase RelE/StbE
LVWIIEYDPRAIKDLKKLDSPVRQEIVEFMEKRIANSRDPRDFGKPLRRTLFGL